MICTLLHTEGAICVYGIISGAVVSFPDPWYGMCARPESGNETSGTATHVWYVWEPEHSINIVYGQVKQNSL